MSVSLASSVSPANEQAAQTANATVLISMDLAKIDLPSTNVGSIYCALYDRKFDAVLTTRRLVHLSPAHINNQEIPWANPKIMEIYTDRRTEDLYLFLVKHANEKNSAAYYGFDPAKLKPVSNQVFKDSLNKPKELPVPKATVDDVMGLFNSAAKVNRRVMWEGHGSPNTLIAGMSREDFLKAHHCLNVMQPQIEGIVTCFVGGMNRLRLASIFHAHPVILFGSDDSECGNVFADTWKTICSNLDKNQTSLSYVKNIRALFEGVERHTTFSIQEEPLVILPFQHSVRLINPSDKFSFVKAGSRAITIPENKLAVLFTTYMANTLRFKHSKSFQDGFFYSQIAGPAHHLLEHVQLPHIAWDEFLKGMKYPWIGGCRVKAFFIKKLSLTDRMIKNVIITNSDEGKLRIIYRLVKDNQAHYFVYRPGQAVQEIDPFTYGCTALEILKDSMPTEESVRQSTGMLEETYPAINHSFITAHPQLAPYQQTFKQFDEQQKGDLSFREEIASLSDDKRALLLTLAKKYDCQPLLTTLKPLKENT